MLGSGRECAARKKNYDATFPFPKTLFFLLFYKPRHVTIYILSIKLIKHAKNINLNMLTIIRTLIKIKKEKGLT